ncbi:pyroglutamyl-peptidase I [Paenibacillus favisporus]|uniref:pyroglutamyl-peptidase I n=1 Tax=Paenibacillus favisporus TaxID=221028 RepID=UPI002DBCBEF8|nr:pyroglutamyl-peptidase I [Paenibacillus favisporus]MEC0179188.1 pyroglutamyl-peptidase I [Paenibacillus favisporus]
MKILVSGFEPFGGNAVNPTEQLVRDIREETFAEAEIRTVLLPVHYDECAERLLEAVRDFQPDAVICCGLAAGRTAVTPERIAVNVKDVAPEAAYADNKGERPQDLPINPAGPDGLFSRLPIREAVNRLKAEGIPAAVSESAGTFICNNTMYAVLDYIREQKLPTLAGFVHFPASTEMALQKPGLPSLPQEMMLRALRVIIHATIDAAKQQRQPAV